jgi:hypothetical protein
MIATHRRFAWQSVLILALLVLASSCSSNGTSNDPAPVAVEPKSNDLPDPTPATDPAPAAVEPKGNDPLDPTPATNPVRPAVEPKNNEVPDSVPTNDSITLDTNDLSVGSTTENKESTETSKAASRYSKEFLAQPGLLLRRFVVPLVHDPGRGLFIGVYGKKHFVSVEQFVVFTANISSITQDWYADGDLDDAYEYYYPPEEDDPGWAGRYIREEARVVEGNLVHVLKQFKADVDFAKLPDDLEGKIYCGESIENGLIGQGDTYFFEVYVADL